jgi:putative ABC transport system ATP-binding protein
MSVAQTQVTQTPTIQTPTIQTAAIRIDSLVFGWKAGQTTLDIPAFAVGVGERVFLRGPSGSGKSTLLSLIGGVATPRSGQLDVLGHDMAKLGSAARDALRGARMGVVFQMFNLVPYLSVIENVLLPCRFSTIRKTRAGDAGASPRQEALRILERLGLAHGLASRRASDLSVGQQQRVAAARALIGAPDLILADEPTSALDADSRQAFIDLLIEECAARKSSLLFVSHDLALAERFDRIVDLATINRAPQTTEA